MEFLAQYGYLGLFTASFLAATILPLSSEVVLGALLAGGLDPFSLVGVAATGNVLGAVVNYWLGYGGGELFKRKFSTASEDEVNASLARFEKYGAGSLLFAWVPVIGDPLTVAAGVLRVNFPLFLLLVTIGKLGRYVAIAYFFPAS
ncbi:YqaA family protein [Pseudodesulfovibrio sp. zrk46]|uniref:YqaA family protein n=1 Tax=Pseudodesulfovibrio sp. zrk46 TaxID=2725288 RepID=UPI001449940A|nr:YqaA family protein [Pseudodesulfovibrio sp. zrk46]QJB57098.1 DedA family protein [Pseudodesulfovibrio sp. zrk46]